MKRWGWDELYSEKGGMSVQGYEGKVAIVTGGGSGIGRALCEALGRGGAKVVVADIGPERAQEVASGLAGAKAVALEVSVQADVENLIEETFTEHGRLDYMFNNAGIPGVGGRTIELGVEPWKRMMDVNLMGVIYGTLAALKVMAGQGSGHIVNTSSLAGLISAPLPPYTTAKHAVVGMTTSLRAEAESLGVRMSVVCPGFVHTPIFDALEVVGADKEKVLKLMPLKREQMLSPERAAGIILDGVEKNKSIIIFPFLARFIWWLYRLSPSIFAPLSRKMVRDADKLMADYRK